jgi:hypothetical protein
MVIERGVLSMRDDCCRQLYLDPIFCHTSNPRVATSATLAAIVVALGTGALFALSSPLTPYSQRPQTAAGGSMAELPPPGSIRVVGITQRPQMPCEQQTWPYIDQHCLVRANANLRIDATPSPAQDRTKLSPLTATSAVPPLPPEQGITIVSTPQDNDSVTQSARLEDDAINVPAQADATVDEENDEVNEIPRQRIDKPVLGSHTYRYHRSHFGQKFLVPFGGFIRRF